MKLQRWHEKEYTKERTYRKTYVCIEMDNADKRVTLCQVVKIFLMLFQSF